MIRLVQDDMSKGSRTSVVTPAIEAPALAVDMVVANSASQAALEASNEAASIANAGANAKAAAKRAKKQRQKAKKQQQQEAHQLQQQKQPDAYKQMVQQLLPQQASLLQSFCSAVSMDSLSSTTSMSAPAVAEAQQALAGELAALAEASAASAAVSQCMAATGTIPSRDSSDLAVCAPQLQPETPETVCNEAYSAQTQQTGLDSAESATDAPETQTPQASAERYASDVVGRACSQELPFCDLKQSFDTARMPGRGDQLPIWPIPSLLCCPITKVRYYVKGSGNHVRF